MRFVSIMLLLSMTSTLTWAGTWRDDFEAEELDEMWVVSPSGLGEGYEWKIEDGELSAQMFDVIPFPWINSLQIGKADGLNWTDYSFEVKVKLLEKLGKVFNAVGFATRVQPERGKTYGISLRSDTEEVIGYKIEAINAITNFFQGKLEFEDKWYNLKIIAEGDNIRFYLDGKLLKSVNDATFKSGYAFLWMANVHAHFDDVIITGTGIPDGGHWNLSKHDVELKNKRAMVWGSIKERI